MGNLISCTLCALLLGCLTIANARSITVAAKSYIATIDLSDPDQFDEDAKGCEQALAAVINCATMGEDPEEGTKESGEYRIWSSTTIDVTCDGDTVKSWRSSGIQTAFGTEFAIFATSGEISEPLKFEPSRGPAEEVEFDFRVKGRPNAVAIAAMSVVKPRTCTYIWHRAKGRLTCSNGDPEISAKIEGSQFPSHRLWVDEEQVSEVEQGPFRELWVCDPNDPFSVK